MRTRPRRNRALPAVAAAVALLLLLAGLPIVLLAAYQQTAVRLDPRQLLGQPDTTALLVLAATALGWALWGWLLYATIRDTADRLRHAHSRLRLPVPLHTAVTTIGGTIAGTVTLLLDTAGTAHAQPSAPHAATDTTTDIATARSDLTPTTASGQHAKARVSAAPKVGETATAEAAGLPAGAGWLPLPAAAAVGAAVALLWTYRRRTYTPRPPTATRDDTDLRPVPPTISRLRRALRNLSSHDNLDGGHDGSIGQTPVNPSPAAPDTAVLGATTTGWLTPADLPRTGLALTGPGAAHAARGILTAIAAHHTAQPATQAPHLMITVDGVHQLLGTLNPVTALPGIHLAANLSTATEHLLATTGSPTRAECSSSRLELVFLHVGPLVPHDAESLHTALATAGDRMRAVVLTTWPPAVRWHTTDNGTVTTDDAAAGLRLATLDRDTAIDVLTTLHRAHPSPPASTASPASTAGATGAGAASPTGSPYGAPPVSASASSTASAADPEPAAPAHARAPQARPRPVLSLQVLGRPAVWTPHPDGSRSQLRIRRSAGLRILIYLAVHRDGATTDTLKEALWPDVTRSAAARSFNTTISELRQTLHAAAGTTVLHQASNRVEPGRSRHWLDPHTVYVDLWQLLDLINGVDTGTTAATTATVGRRQQLTRAAELGDQPGGELATGHDDEWLDPHRETIARHLIDLHAHLAATEPDHHTAIAILHRAIRLAPHNEALQQQLTHRLAATDRHRSTPAEAHRTEQLPDRRTQPGPAADQPAAHRTETAGTAGTVDVEQHRYPTDESAAGRQERR